MSDEIQLKPCPFCGSQPELPHGYGTQYEIECDGCGMASASVQISDPMTLNERMTGYDAEDHRFADQYIERAKAEAIAAWNRRAPVIPSSDSVYVPQNDEQARMMLAVAMNYLGLDKA